MGHDSSPVEHVEFGGPLQDYSDETFAGKIAYKKRLACGYGELENVDVRRPSSLEPRGDVWKRI
jgi:hypothetical protein